MWAPLLLSVNRLLVAQDPTALDSEVTRQSPTALPGALTWLFEWQTIAGAFFSGFLAFAVVLVWEGWLAPARVGRNVALALMGETSVNVQLLGAQRSARHINPNSVPSDFRLSRVALDTVAQRVAELPPHALDRVLLFYHRVDLLNSFPQTYADALRERRRMRDDSKAAQTVEQELDSIVGVFYQYIDSSIEHASELQTILKSAAERGTWRRVKTAELSQDDLDRKVAGILAEQRQRTARMKAKREGTRRSGKRSKK